MWGFVDGVRDMNAEACIPNLELIAMLWVNIAAIRPLDCDSRGGRQRSVFSRGFFLVRILFHVSSYDTDLFNFRTRAKMLY